MPLYVIVRTEVQLLIDDEDTLLYLRHLTQNPHPEHQDNGEPEQVRIQRGEVFEACDRALKALAAGDDYGGFKRRKG